MDKLIASLPSSGAPLEHLFDALELTDESAEGLEGDDWSPFHLLNAHRKNLRAPSRMFLAGEISWALGDDLETLWPRRALVDAHLLFDRSNGAPYAALYDGGVRLANLTPGGVWVGDLALPARESASALYLFGPLWGRLRLAPLGRRQRLSPLAG